jgi:hypothetical protein
LALPEAPVVVRSPSGAAQVGAGDSERIGLAIRQVAPSLGCPSLPVMEAVLTCLLTAMSLLAFLGLRYPVRMLPILLFEVLWKVIWIAAVALPHLGADDIDTATREVLVNCSLVVIIIAVIPWRYVWERYIRAPADAWR